MCKLTMILNTLQHAMIKLITFSRHPWKNKIKVIHKHFNIDLHGLKKMRVVNSYEWVSPMHTFTLIVAIVTLSSRITTIQNSFFLFQYFSLWTVVVKKIPLCTHTTVYLFIYLVFSTSSLQKSRCTVAQKNSWKSTKLPFTKPTKCWIQFHEMGKY